MFLPLGTGNQTVDLDRRSQAASAQGAPRSWCGEGGRLRFEPITL
jgi:hypothetical protein